MAGFLGVPEKRTDPVSLYNKLANIFATSVDEAVQNNFRESLKKLDALRTDAISGHKRLASGISLEEALSRYIDQLVFLENAIPKQHLGVPFTWKNAFSNGTIIIFYTFFTQPTISFEKLCMLFNLAAFLSQHAAGRADGLEEEGLREGAKLFQRSAGLFQYIRHISSVSTVEGVTTDLHLGTLQALENLCVAQAQECFYLKALQDGKASSILARLAQRAMELYETAWKYMRKEHPCSYQWAYVMQFKEAAFRGAAQFHQAEQDGKDGRVGDELMRLNLAIQAFAAANKQAEYVTILVLGPHWKEMCKNAQAIHKKRNFENECIYKEKVTPVEELPAIESAVLAKTNPPVIPLTSEESLFGNLPQEFRTPLDTSGLQPA